jgi:hypothetical protein
MILVWVSTEEAVRHGSTNAGNKVEIIVVVVLSFDDTTNKIIVRRAPAPRSVLLHAVEPSSTVALSKPISNSNLTAKTTAR